MHMPVAEKKVKSENKEEGTKEKFPKIEALKNKKK